MKKYNYKIYTTDNFDTIAVSTYAGRPVRGKASLHPGDEYDATRGALIAEARCAAKIAHKRRKRAIAKKEEAYQALLEAQRQYDKMLHYYLDADLAAAARDTEVAQLLAMEREDTAE